jgi:hypothetical protein
MARYSPSSRRVTGDAGGPALPRWCHISSGSTSSMATREVLYDLLQEMGVSDEGGSDPECESGVADP